MRATPALFRLALCLSSLTPLVSAWPEWLPEIDSLVVRQDNGGDSTTSKFGAQQKKKTPTTHYNT